jgi:hypothetical protein
MPATKKPRKLDKPPVERISQFTTPVDDDTLDFIRAIEQFKIERHRPFPSWGEVLAVLKGLGYERRRS